MNYKVVSPLWKRCVPGQMAIGLCAGALMALSQTPTTPPAATTPPASAASAPKAPATLALPSGRPTKIAIIEIQSALVGTKDGQKAAAELQARIGPKQKALEAKQAEIRDLQDKLNRSGSTMSENAKQDLMREIDSKTKDYNREIEDVRSEADDEQRKLLEELGQKMRKVLSSYATTHGYSVILDVSNPNTPVIWADETVDITRDIIELYDKTQPSAPSSGPATPAPKPATSTPAVVKKP